VYTERELKFGLDGILDDEGKMKLLQLPGTDAVSIIDGGTNTGHPGLREAQFVMPAVTDKIHYLMKKFEVWNKLISESGVIRFDFGFEVLPAGAEQNYATRKVPTPAIEAAELNECMRQMNPSQWSATGRGFITRVYLNEVSRSMHRAVEELEDWAES
jgi:hypothetical protein